MILWIFFIVVIIAGVVFAWKKGYLKNIMAPNIQLREGMRVLWCEKESDEYIDSVVAEVSPNGEYIRFEPMTKFIKKSEIIVKDKWPLPKAELPTKHELVLPVTKIEQKPKAIQKVKNGAKAK